jgi:xylulokinase
MDKNVLPDVVLALDVGTGGARVMAYDLAGALVASSEAEYPTFYDRPAWAEQEPEDWWRGALLALKGIASQLERHRVRAIGLTGQSPSIAPFGSEGRALRRGIIYQDNRAVREAEEWRAQPGGREAVHRRTGHDPEAFYLGPKILWVQRHEPDVFARTFLWLQPRDFVAWRLTGQAATDWSHAGSTLLFDLLARTWAADLFARFDIPPETFPPALAPWAVLGEVLPSITEQTGLSSHIPVVLGGVDSQCCVVGAGVLNSSELSDMAGTSTCLNAPVRQPLDDLRIANYCHVVPDWWCTELGLNASGAAFEWLAALLAPPGSAPLFAECEAAARQSAAGAAGLIFLPYMADGERFNPALRGGFAGLSLRHGRGDLARAVFEGVAFAIREHLEIMAEAGAPVHEIHVSGGGASVDLWNQIKADVTGVPVVAVTSDATSLGVGLVAATAVGLYPSLQEAVGRCVRVSRRYEPDTLLTDLYAERYARFRTLAAATQES